jgi:hypothetical protein
MEKCQKSKILEQLICGSNDTDGTNRVSPRVQESSQEEEMKCHAKVGNTESIGEKCITHRYMMRIMSEGYEEISESADRSLKQIALSLGIIQSQTRIIVNISIMT